jgi:predicted nucleic acid-binding protein
MTDKFFMDSNVLVYAHTDVNLAKQAIAQNIIEMQIPTISIQVLNEFSNVLHKKYKVEWSKILKLISEISGNTVIYENTFLTVSTAINLAIKTGYAYYDSQIIAAALDVRCTVLYSEDMQHGQIIEGRLKIINPFV